MKFIIFINSRNNKKLQGLIKHLITFRYIHYYFIHLLSNLLLKYFMKKELELYELVLLFKFTTTEQETISKTEFYRNFLVDRGSQVLVKNQGKVSLAYPIKGFDIATSVQIIFLGNGDLLKQMNVEIKRDATILRAITTKLVNQTAPEMFTVG